MRFSHYCRKHFGKHWISEAVSLGMAVEQPNNSYKKPS